MDKNKWPDCTLETDWTSSKKFANLSPPPRRPTGQRAATPFHQIPPFPVHPNPEDIMATSQFSPGDIIDGRYELIEVLGEGSFAVAVRAWDKNMARRVVLKILKPTKRDEIRRRFIAEAQIMATLADSDHPHHDRVVRVYSVSAEDAGVLYMAMEYAPGGDLQHKLYYEKPSLHAALCMFLLILYGVQVAHERVLDGRPAEVIHRDLKPANIVIDGTGKPKITDFGIANSQLSMAETGPFTVIFGTGIGARFGTLGYAPPEQTNDTSSVDARGDVYALGVILAVIAADFNPGEEGRRLLYQEKLQKQYLESVPADVRAVIVKAVHADPDKRYQTVREFIAAVQALIKAHPDTGEPAWTPRPGRTRPAATPTPKPPTPGEKIDRPAAPATPPPDDPAPSATAIPDAPGEPEAQGVLWTEIGSDSDEAGQPDASAPSYLQQPAENPTPTPRKRKTGWVIGALALVVLTVGSAIMAWQGQAVVTELPTETRPQVPPEPVETKAETHIVPTIPVIEPVVKPPPEVKIEAKAKVKPKTEVKPRIDPPKEEPEPVTVTTVKIVGPREISATASKTVTLQGTVALPEGATIGSVSLRWRGKDGIAQEASVKQNGENLSADIVATGAVGEKITCYFDVRLKGKPEAYKSPVVTITIE